MTSLLLQAFIIIGGGAVIAFISLCLIGYLFRIVKYLLEYIK